VIASVHFLEGSDADVGVNGRGLQLGVAEHLLHIPHIAAVLQQKRGEPPVTMVNTDYNAAMAYP